MNQRDIPTLALGITVCLYWFNVAKMIWLVGRRTRRIGRVLIPPQRRERFMWIVWVPLIFAWLNVPLAAALSTAGQASWWIRLPDFAADSPALLVIRGIAALIAVLCLGLSTWCWRHMGTDWRMGVEPNPDQRLIVDGPFSRVRHPIYALSIILMTCSLVILPSPVMIVIAVVHITLMHLKARNEERFLLEKHGPSYAEYCMRTGRFLPLLRSCREATRCKTP